MLTSATHDCVSVALVNAVFALSGEDAAGPVREVIESAFHRTVSHEIRCNSMLYALAGSRTYLRCA